MGIGGVTVEYTDSGGTQHTFRRYVATTGDAATFLSGDGTTIALTGATPTGSNVNAGQVARAFMKAYEFFAPDGSVIRSVSADFRTTGGPGVVEATATFNVSGFTPAGGNSGHGPFPIGFVAIRARATESHRPGWIR
jgi:hypothetical protein